MSCLVYLAGLSLCPSAILPPAELLRTAVNDFNRQDWPHADNEFRALLGNPTFGDLDEISRHTVFSLAAQTSLKLNNPVDAHKLAVQATELSQATVEDWNFRLAAAGRNEDGRDQAFCVTSILRRWGTSDNYLTQSVIFIVFNANDRSDLGDAEFDMLEALYQRRWKPDSGASRLWLTFTRLLLARGDSDRAAQVAVQIDAPEDIIVLHADRRFSSVLKSRFVQKDPQAAAHQRLKELEQTSRNQPRSEFSDGLRRRPPELQLDSEFGRARIASSRTFRRSLG